MKKSIKTILSVVLVIALLGTSCVFAADSASKEPQRVQVATTFYNANGGSCSVTDTVNNVGSPYGSLPVPTRSGFVFIGWFPDQSIEGIEVTSSTLVTSGVHYLYAHWAYPQTIFNYGTQTDLNIDGSNLTSLSNGMNVTGWTYSGSNEQKWLSPESSNCFYVRSYVDRDYGLNAYRSGSPWNCNIRKVIGNETDAQIFSQTAYATDGTPGIVYYLKNYSNNTTNKVLTIGSSYNGSNAYWTTRSSSDNKQIWL